MHRRSESQDFSGERRGLESILEIGAILVVVAWLLGIAAGYGDALHSVVHTLGATAGVVLAVRIVRSLGK